jgi:hypothetical protein
MHAMAYALYRSKKKHLFGTPILSNSCFVTKLSQTYSQIIWGSYMYIAKRDCHVKKYKTIQIRTRTVLEKQGNNTKQI